MAICWKFLMMKGWTSVVELLGQLDGAHAHLLGAAAGGQKADADLDQAHIGLGIGVDRIGMQAEFGPAAKRHAKGCGNHRHFGVFHRHGRLLEGLDHHGDIVIGAFGQGHGHHHQIGADREVDALVADNQADTFALPPV